MVPWYWLLVVWIVTEAATLVVVALVSANARELELEAPTPEEIAAARRAAVDGTCGSCSSCPAYRHLARHSGDHSELFGVAEGASEEAYVRAKKLWFRAWLVAHGIPVEDPLEGVPS